MKNKLKNIFQYLITPWKISYKIIYQYFFSSLLNEWGPNLTDKKLKDEIKTKISFHFFSNKININKKNGDQI
jgi:hypothetical protein